MSLTYKMTDAARIAIKKDTFALKYVVEFYLNNKLIHIEDFILFRGSTLIVTNPEIIDKDTGIPLGQIETTDVGILPFVKLQIVRFIEDHKGDLLLGVLTSRTDNQHILDRKSHEWLSDLSGEIEKVNPA